MNDIVRPDFDNMPIAKLREYARHMNIALAKTAKAEEIKEAIIRKLAGRSSAVIAERGTKVPPGHAKSAKMNAISTVKPKYQRV